MLLERIKNYDIILGSKSPRRHFLLSEIGLTYKVITPEVDESYPKDLKAEKIPLYLAQKKAEALADHLAERVIIITADTIVWINNSCINKPGDNAEAYEMLQLLSGNRHEVYTGVCIKSLQKEKCFYVKSCVYFKKLHDDEIKYYLEHYKPLDKAGAYGIQEWIGYIGIQKVEGSFYNVMGLPVTRVYEHLEKFV